MNAYNDIEQKYSETSIKDFLVQNFWDRSPQEYHAITAIKNYFGERIGFHYAFMTFYNCWLIVPSIGSLIYGLFYLLKWETQFAAFCFSLGICLWMTMFYERWKRKQNEYRLFWGTSINTSKNQLIRNEFKGNEYYDFQGHNVGIKDISINTTLLMKILNLFVVILFIFICMISFYYSKALTEFSPEDRAKPELKTKLQIYGVLAGVVNNVIIGVTNFFYQKILEPMVNFENHKYQVDHNIAFVRKLFFFQFINANMSIFWSIYFVDDNDLDQLNLLLVGMIVSKIGSLFASQVVLKFVLFRYKKWSYFKKCKE